MPKSQSPGKKQRSKPVKLTSPRELQAIKEYIELQEKMKAHILFVGKRQEQEVKDMYEGFNVLFREIFSRAAGAHIKDPIAAFSAGSHYLDARHFKNFGDAYLIERGDENEEDSESEIEPQDFSGEFEKGTVH